MLAWALSTSGLSLAVGRHDFCTNYNATILRKIVGDI